MTTVSGLDGGKIERNGNSVLFTFPNGGKVPAIVDESERKRVVTSAKSDINDSFGSVAIQFTTAGEVQLINGSRKPITISKSDLLILLT